MSAEGSPGNGTTPAGVPPDTRDLRRDENLWRNLFSLIEYGSVVPIVGRELLQVDAPGGGRTHLYTQLAEGVACKLQVEFDPQQPVADPLNTVACRYLAKDNADAREIYLKVFEETRSLPNGNLPEALLKLAAIDQFKLFLTTTFDDSLRNAINKTRFKGDSRTEVLAFTPKKTRDLSKTLDEVTLPIVYHLLGRVSPTDDYVVTEEDALEFVHSLQRSFPSLLFNELYPKNLLVIGCRFPAWLVRSFIRLARSERLLQARGSTVFVVDSGAREDRALIDFLKTFRTRIDVFEHESPLEFVDELHQRWQARHPEAQAAAPAAGGEGAQPQLGDIFINYASEDRQIAEAIAKALGEAQLSVWLDRAELEAGDRFDDRIEQGIKRSELFIPVLSRNCLQRRERYFRKEWGFAFDKSNGLPGSIKFVFPVVIDDLPYDSGDLPGQLRSLHWYPLGGGPTAEFVAAVKKRYRENQGD